MCCQLELEGVAINATDEVKETCNGNKLTMDSTCCKDGAEKKCPGNLCLTYGIIDIIEKLISCYGLPRYRAHFVSFMVASF